MGGAQAVVPSEVTRIENTPKVPKPHREQAQQRIHAAQYCRSGGQGFPVGGDYSYSPGLHTECLPAFAPENGEEKHNDAERAQLHYPSRYRWSSHGIGWAK